MKNRRTVDGCWNCKHCAILYGVNGGICRLIGGDPECKECKGAGEKWLFNDIQNAGEHSSGRMIMCNCASQEVLFYEVCDDWQRRPEGRNLE